MPPLVLASTSPYRKALLERLRLPFRCEPPGVDEAAVKRDIAQPGHVVRALALRKAHAVAERFPDAIVIGSDQCACIDGRVLDKPGSAAAARRQLADLQGREHELLTAVAIVSGSGAVEWTNRHAVAAVRGEQVTEWTDRTLLSMRSLTDDELERYVAADEPFDCAGSYRIEGLGIALFERVVTEDQTAIVGLPLLRLCAELRRFGVALP
jgi:septum formation protein